MTKRTLDSVIDIPTFQKYWIYDRPYGHDIVIAAETGKTTIKCRWTDRKRGPMGRVSRKNAEITK
jgi:hypothetical protein|tara:strand:- start:200 stop:394 length:195 start_codon:yes stop_codon:yes gene_type:complete